MMKISATQIATAALAVLLTVPVLTAQSEEQPGASPAVSKARIVRLSEVRGDVQMDRGVGRGFEPAMANLPIVENCSLQTGNGIAEIEFEDNSTLHLGPGSEVEFPTLERLANGGTRSSVRVLKGMAYVSLMKTPANEFHLLFGQQSIELPASSHVRLQLEGDEAKVAVLGGALQIKGAQGVVDVPHKNTITFALAGSSDPAVAKSVASNPYDSWDHNADEYHARVATVSALNGTPYAYGLSDMMYYGDFANVGGCGMMWRPYFASAAWDPYSNGAWAWYGGTGYSWVSPYPWGWTPYHYGAWSFCPGTGWGWTPGGAWMGLNNTVGFAGLKGPTTIPRVPIRSPRAGEPGLMMVNQRPLIQSQVDSSNAFLFRRDSAGLGIPRDELGKLNKFSEHAIAKGTTSTPVYMQAPESRQANGRAAFGGVTSMHRGSPPAEMPHEGMEGHGGMGGGHERMGGGQGQPSGGSGAHASNQQPMSSAPSGAHTEAPSGRNH